MLMPLHTNGGSESMAKIRRRKGARRFHSWSKGVRGKAMHIEVVQRPKGSTAHEGTSAGFWGGTVTFGSVNTGTRILNPPLNPMMEFCEVCGHASIPGERRCYTCAHGSG